MEKGTKDVKSKYFQLPHPAAMIAVILGMGLTALCCYRPDKVPYDYMGPVGSLARYLAVEKPILMQLIWYPAVMVHAGEALYSLSASSSKGLESTTQIKWFLSTLCFGGFSLQKLSSYKVLKN